MLIWREILIIGGTVGNKQFQLDMEDFVVGMLKWVFFEMKRNAFCCCYFDRLGVTVSMRCRKEQ